MKWADSRKSLLVVDDEDSICLAFQRFFGSRGWDVSVAASAREGIEVHRASKPSVVFLDVRLPDGNGLGLLDELAGSGSGIVVVTAYGGLDTVIRSIHGRAYDYLTKPLDLDQALELADRILECGYGAEHLDNAGDTRYRETLIGRSPAMQDVYKLIARASVSASPVLIQGETGTGKELAARAIHEFSPRKDAPFIAVNCGAIPDNLIESELFGHVRGAFTGAERDRIGRFESADGGCLLLDEIADLPPATQVKLLRILDNGVVERVGSSRHRKVDVRVIAVTNKCLKEEVRSGRFREDLYYRLAVLQLCLPPLRQRKKDIPLLAAHFVNRASAIRGASRSLSDDAMQALKTHAWPGNVRELRNALEHAVAVIPHQMIQASDLPEFVRIRQRQGTVDRTALAKTVVDFVRELDDNGAGRSHRTMEEVERALITFAMERYHGNQSEAAEYLGLHRNTLRNKLRELLPDQTNSRW